MWEEITVGRYGSTRWRSERSERSKPANMVRTRAGCRAERGVGALRSDVCRLMFAGVVYGWCELEVIAMAGRRGNGRGDGRSKVGRRGEQRVMGGG